MIKTPKKAIIIGAGVGGLATGAILGKMGYDVTILEKNKETGGRISVLSEKGFTFDTGPSWYQMPDIFESYFKLFGKKPTDFFKLKKLDPMYRVFFSDYEIVDIGNSIKDNFRLFESMQRGSSTKVRKYLNSAKYQYRVIKDDFLYKNYKSVLDLINPTVIAEGPRLPVFENLDKYISRFTNNKKLKKILMYYTLFNGGSPRNTPAMYSIFSHLDFHTGVFYPLGGIYKVIEALEKLCVMHNVKIKTSEEVINILTDKGKANGVETRKNTYYGDVVISNADYPYTETQLLEEKYQTYTDDYWDKKTIAPSAFMILLGIKGKVKKLKHHNLFFADDWEKHFNEIFNKPQWPQEPSYYVCCPSKDDPATAPKGDETVSIYIPVSSALNDTKEQRNAYSKKIIKHLEQMLNEKLSARIKVKRTISVNDYREMYNSFNGTALGLTPKTGQIAMFRPQNKSRKLKNLYYVGQYTIPGTGIPMCLISSQLVTERIRNEQH